MAHVSDIVLRRSIAIDSLQARVISESMLDVEGLHPEAIQVDAVIHRFFDAFALGEYLRAKADLSRHAEVNYFVIDTAMVDQLQRILEVARSGRPELSQTFVEEVDELRLLNAIGALLTEDARGNLAQLNFALNQISSYVDQASFTVFYRAEGN